MGSKVAEWAEKGRSTKTGYTAVGPKGRLGPIISGGGPMGAFVLRTPLKQSPEGEKIRISRGKNNEKILFVFF